MEVKIIGKMDHTIDHTFESANRVYDKNGIAPTINTCGGGGLQPKIIDEVKSIGNLSETKTQSRTVYDSGGISPTLCSGMDHGNTMPHICEKSIVAMRGRNPENPSDRTVGAPTEQRLEPNSQGICNTLTSVQKDNMVLEKQICAVDEQNMNLRYETFGTLTTDGSSPKHNNRVMEIRVCGIDKVGQIEGTFDQSGRVYNPKGISPTIMSNSHGNTTGGYIAPKITEEYRIRKLTPKECWRLMAFTDEDFYKAETVNSNTQLYKQAGNSIVVNVLEAILGQMIPGKEDVYKTRYE